MDIKELKEEKAKMEGDIFEFIRTRINEFEKKTRVRISDVELQKEFVEDEGPRPFNHVVGFKAVIIL